MQPYTITCWGDLRSHAVGILAALAWRLQGQGEGERVMQLQRASLLVCVASTQGVKEGYTCPDTLTLPLRVEGGKMQSQELAVAC